MNARAVPAVTAAAYAVEREAFAEGVRQGVAMAERAVYEGMDAFAALVHDVAPVESGDTDA